MKKILLGSLLLSLSSALLPAAPSQHINLDVKLLGLIDGTDYIDIGEIFEFAANGLSIVNGTNLETAERLNRVFDLKDDMPEPLADHVKDNGKVGLIYFKNTYVTLIDLVQYEKEYGFDEEAQEALDRACHHFEKFSEGYVDEIQSAKDIMVKIIEQWCKLRGRSDSMLLGWSQIDNNEYETFYSTMTSCEVFYTLLKDLLQFLRDFVQNCPKSHKQYRDKLQKK